METQQGTGATTDVGAIANAAGKLFDLAGLVIDNVTLEKNSYFGRLAEQGTPRINDWWAGYKTDFTKQNQTIIIALIFVIGLLVVAAAVSRK